MTGRKVTIPLEQMEFLDEAGLDVQQLARCGRVSVEWISLRVQAGVLQPQRGDAVSEWRFAGASLVRVQRLRQLERAYDADPQLAALAVDLMEEVARLRRRLQAL